MNRHVSSRILAAAGAGVLVCTVSAGVASASPASAADPSAASLESTVLSAVKAQESVLGTRQADGTDVLRFTAPSGTVVETLHLTADASATEYSDWRAATAGPSIAPATVDRVTCPPYGDHTSDTVIWSGPYVDCFAAGAGNVAIYDVSELASNSYDVAYVLNPGGELEYLDSNEYIEFSTNPEITYLNVYT